MLSSFLSKSRSPFGFWEAKTLMNGGGTLDGAGQVSFLFCPYLQTSIFKDIK
jgi:hypothetical protein